MISKKYLTISLFCLVAVLLVLPATSFGVTCNPANPANFGPTTCTQDGAACTTPSGTAGHCDMRPNQINNCWPNETSCSFYNSGVECTTPTGAAGKCVAGCYICQPTNTGGGGAPTNTNGGGGAGFGYNGNYKITTSVPGTNIVRGDTIAGLTLAKYIKTLYVGALALVGLIAFIMIIYWGFKYVFSAGNASQTADAKTGIFQAVLGIILLLAGYLILQFINPALVNIQESNFNLPVITNTPTQTPTSPTVPPQPGVPSQFVYSVTSASACAELGGTVFSPCQTYCLATPGLCSASNVCCGKKP